MTTSWNRVAWLDVHSVWMEDLGELSSSLQMPELAVGLRLFIFVSSVDLRRLLSESSFLKSVFVLPQEEKQCTKSWRRWPLKIMYIQGLQQLLRLARSADRVTAVFSESREPRGKRKKIISLQNTWCGLAAERSAKVINKNEKTVSSTSSKVRGCVHIRFIPRYFLLLVK